MSVYRPKDCKTYRYRFLDLGRWYRGSTGQLQKADAELWEHKLKLKIRRAAGGIARFSVEDTPHITEWAAVYYREASKQVLRPERIKDLIRVALRFWGATPRPGSPNKRVDGEPYHNLRLADPILDPSWILKFEDWMDGKRWAGQTKNQYRSVMSQMYALALSPLWRKTTNVQVNPFVGVTRDATAGRDVTMTADELRAFLAVASYHVRLAVAIGALAPKLRLANILSLRWSEHFDRQLRFITVYRHKTAKRTRRPLVVAISAQLRTILEDAQRRSPSDYVVSYRGQPIDEIRGGVRGACERAGLPYGRYVENGITFHVLRHTAATIMAELDLPEERRRRAMGHTVGSTTQGYTHLRPVHEISVMEQLSAALPIDDLVTQRWKRAKKPDLKPDQVAPQKLRKAMEKDGKEKIH